jgi:hypothetical protein
MTTTTTTDAFEDVIAGWGRGNCMQVRPRLQPTGHLASDTPQIMRRPEGDMRRPCSAVDGGGDGNHCRVGRNTLPWLWRGVPDARTMHPFPAAVGAKLLPRSARHPLGWRAEFVRQGGRGQDYRR